MNEEIKYIRTENGYKVSMPLITDDELEIIDFNFHSIVDEYIKEFSNKKEKTIEQRLIYDLRQENKQLKEKIEYLKNQKENKDKWFQLIADIGFDYDGYNDVENLKHLIDELVKFALNGRDNYEYENIFEELESGDSNE